MSVTVAESRNCKLSDNEQGPSYGYNRERIEILLNDDMILTELPSKHRKQPAAENTGRLRHFRLGRIHRKKSLSFCTVQEVVK